MNLIKILTLTTQLKKTKGTDMLTTLYKWNQDRNNEKYARNKNEMDSYTELSGKRPLWEGGL